MEINHIVILTFDPNADGDSDLIFTNKADLYRWANAHGLKEGDNMIIKDLSQDTKNV